MLTKSALIGQFVAAPTDARKRGIVRYMDTEIPSAGHVRGVWRANCTACKVATSRQSIVCFDAG
jgi:hypothetical protein